MQSAANNTVGKWSFALKRTCTESSKLTHRLPDVYLATSFSTQGIIATNVYCLMNRLDRSKSTYMQIKRTKLRRKHQPCTSSLNANSKSSKHGLCTVQRATWLHRSRKSDYKSGDTATATQHESDQRACYSVITNCRQSTTWRRQKQWLQSRQCTIQWTVNSSIAKFDNIGHKILATLYWYTVASMILILR